MHVCASLLVIAVIAALSAIAVVAAEAVWREDARRMRRLARQRHRFRFDDDAGPAGSTVLLTRVRGALTTDRADVTIAGLLAVLSVAAFAGALAVQP